MQLLVRAAFAVGKFPWELNLTVEQFQFLRAADSLGLVPNPYDVGWRIGSCMAKVERDQFMPRPDYRTQEQREKQEAASLTAGAGAISQDVTFE